MVRKSILRIFIFINIITFNKLYNNNNFIHNFQLRTYLNTQKQ